MPKKPPVLFAVALLIVASFAQAAPQTDRFQTEPGELLTTIMKDFSDT